MFRCDGAIGLCCDIIYIKEGSTAGRVDGEIVFYIFVVHWPAADLGLGLVGSEMYIGNKMRVKELADEGRFRPELVIGVPVGFVNVVEAKEMILGTDIPHIVARGRKGGSNIAAAIVNALLYQVRREE